MISAVIEAFKYSVMFLCTPFANRCLVYSDWALYITLHTELTSHTRRDSPCVDSPDQDSGFGIRDSPDDHRSIGNKEVNFI